jgi:hypothetical protein
MYFPRCTTRLVIKANKHRERQRGSFSFEKKSVGMQASKPLSAKLGRTKRIVYLLNAWRNGTTERKRSHVGSLMANHGEYTHFGTFFQRRAAGGYYANSRRRADGRIGKKRLCVLLAWLLERDCSPSAAVSGRSVGPSRRLDACMCFFICSPRAQSIKVIMYTAVEGDSGERGNLSFSLV